MTDSAGHGMTTVLLVLCATVIMVVLLRRRQFRSATRPGMARDSISRIRQQHGLRDSIDELLVQLEEVSRRVGAQVDTKFAKLETVIRDADERIAKLERLVGRNEQAKSSAAPRPADGKQPAPRPAPPPSRHASPEPTDPRVQRVHELVDAGASPIEAAEQLGLPLGEVELILSLRELR